MNKEQESEIKTKSHNYMLFTSEYMGTKTFKYMIRAELRGAKKSTLFLLGIPDPILLYANATNTEPNAINDKLFLVANRSVADYINKNEWVEGKIYYGEYVVSGSFEISPEKPDWEDSNWGTKI